MTRALAVDWAPHRINRQCYFAWSVCYGDELALAELPREVPEFRIQDSAGKLERFYGNRWACFV